MAERRDWDPLAELRGVQRRLNALLDSTLARADFEAGDEVDLWSPICDAWFDGGKIDVCVELPGIPRSAVEVRLEGEALVVEGRREMAREADDERYHRVERSYGRFSRRIRLPMAVDPERVEARLADGVLRLTLPLRSEPLEGPRRVAIDP